jgi:hypothetical protein
MMSKMSQVWQMKPVQMGAKSIAAGSVIAVSLLLFNSATKKMFGRQEGLAVASLANEMPEDRSMIQMIEDQDPELLDILARLLPFRRFAPKAFKDLVVSCFLALELRESAYKETPIKATTSFRIRQAFQKIIEDTRLFRAILELHMPTTLEDFDDVAVDLNAKVEQACTDAIQDTFL